MIGAPDLLRKGLPWFAGMVFLVALLLWGLLRTGPGYLTIEWALAKATGGEVVVAGLEGALPGQLHAARIELRDADGVWLRATNVSLKWTAFRMLWNHVAIHALSAERIVVARLPHPSSDAPADVPRIDIDTLSLPDIRLESPVVGQPAGLSMRGVIHYASRHDLRADLVVLHQGSGRYVARGAIVKDVANGKVTISERADGLLGRLIGLPGLGPTNLSAVASGSRQDNRMSVTLTAGKLAAQGQGMLSLAQRRVDLSFKAQAPAMRLNSDLAWASLDARGRLRGRFDAPDVTADWQLRDVRAGGYRAAALMGTISGAGGRINANARLEELHLPGSASGLLANAPVRATLVAYLSLPQRPVRFSLRHPLVQLEGSARTRGIREIEARVSVPSLAPFSALAGGDLGGSAAGSFKASLADGKTSLVLKGDINSHGGSIPARLLGHATLAGQATLSGNDVVGARLTLQSPGLSSRIEGDARGGRLGFDVSLKLDDFSRLTPALKGRGALSGRVTGPTSKPVLAASGRMDIASQGFAPERLDINLRAVGLPQPLSATFEAHGRFDRARMRASAVLSDRGPSRAVKLAGEWKSLALRGDFGFAAGGAVTGQGTVDLKSLADLSPFIGSAAKGSVHLAGQFKSPGGHTAFFLQGRASDVHLGAVALNSISITGTVTEPFAPAAATLELEAPAFIVQGWTGQARATMKGQWDRLIVQADAKLRDPGGAPASLSAGALLNARALTLELRQVRADWRSETLRLRTPARISFANGLSVDQLNLAAAGGSILLSGGLSPALDLTLKAQDIHAEAVSLFLPQFSVGGTFSVSASLHGSLGSPVGELSLRGRGLRNRVYAVTSAATADLDAHVALHRTSAALDATLTSGRSARLALAGDVPLAPNGALNLRLTGNADLALLDPILGAGGQRLRGIVRLDTVIAGTINAPRARGSATLTGGEFQDFPRGIRVQDIKADITAGKEGIHILSLSAKAGAGTIAGSGDIDVWRGSVPVNLTLRADNARPIVSDLLSAVLSGSAQLSGNLRGDMTLKGAITVPRAEITLPRSFPPEVRTLNVRHRGTPALQPAKHGGALALDLSIRTTGPVTLRGRGIDADLAGNLDIRGTARAPRVGGGFEMRRGTLTVAGQVLSFTTGRVTFNGTGVRGRMDPALDFVASQTSEGVTATLTVGGYASAPKITLSSVPQLPQDEVIARLLFQQSAKRLGPLQLAQGAQALASIAGIGSGFNPLASLRGGLGLDRLSVGSGTETSGTTVEAGKYVSRNVYIGAREGISGGTQAQVQVDLTRNLKAQATISTFPDATATQGATALEDQGSSVGLSYHFDY